MIPIQRTNLRIKADPRKVVLRFLKFASPDRFESVVHYVLGLEDAVVEAQLQEVYAEFQSRHFDLKAAFLENYEKLAFFITEEPPMAKKLLIGAYFTHEYATEAAALFNPSIVPHPDQQGLKEGELRFILTLRSTGEGHISSITFQTGLISADGQISMDPTDHRLHTGQKVEDISLDKSFVLRRMESEGGINSLVSDKLPERFTEREALALIDHLEQAHKLELSSDKEHISHIFDHNYDLKFKSDTPISSRVIFPNSRSESNGMEDARFVFFSDGEEKVYLGTYTAYNGRAIRPQLIETKDFQYFRIRPLYGKAATDKGMALFPEKINGKYAKIGRQGGRNLTVMYSDDLHFWEEHKLLQQPARSWEILQMGNGGSPLKTPYGWLLLTHAVGPMRKYVLSFTLLDLHQPEIVLGSLSQPLLSPNEEERNGYVPNVLYTCGLLQHRENLIIPYAMSDSAVSFAVVETEALIRELDLTRFKSKEV